MSPANNTNFF
jgi:hypothetical protein